MTELFFPLRDRFLLSPRTASYIDALIREGDKFDYSKWLQRVREEEAQAKQGPRTFISENWSHRKSAIKLVHPMVSGRTGS